MINYTKEEQMKKQRFFYCPVCGGKLEIKFLYDLDRLICTECGRIHFENPIVGVAAIIRNDANEILLVKRSEESTCPGYWCIPCGYVEYNEDIRLATAREALEETGLTVEILDVYDVHSNYHRDEQSTVGVWFNTRVISGVPIAGDDAVDICWAKLDDTPPLAFPTDKLILQRLISEEME